MSNLPVIISGIACVISAISLLVAISRNNKSDDEKVTTLIVEMRVLQSSINEIRIDTKRQMQDVQDLRERIIKIENGG